MKKLDLANILWEAGILSVILLFGAKIGLAMGLAGLSKKKAAAIAIAYAAGILGLSALANPYMETLHQYFTEYASIMTIVMATILIVAGAYTIKEWKQHQKNTATTTCLAMIAPCPCCFGAVTLSIILIAPLIGATALTIGKYAAILLGIFIGIFYFTSKIIARASKRPYPILLGNFMLFAGLYFLASAIVLPNINTVLSSKMSPITIPNPQTLAYAIIGAILLIGFGMFINRKNSTLID
ncbi:MAG TPA: DUF2162 domain-containing protein [Methanothermobacter sp.]|nr:DUF2162 domain-containing protein [Methanothermobacter tenebrarum]MDI6881369.1 DUF2162 domain-containing protein [Methanothermobacter sp.]MDX9693289.1 DUF2162 domain-containing protein [Methanothermobacter sp.]HHW15904.1 DUF2162 domain-containing protein [Methanothermobacter sp.]HOQ20321.1 DUF2162 domain-containing protein [Methanothermobacter sp.]